MAAVSIVALAGDETGQELLEQALRVLDPEASAALGAAGGGQAT
jgi:isocitrate/isopropylmalate dehydrogenase